MGRRRDYRQVRQAHLQSSGHQPWEGEQMAVKPIPEGYHSVTPYLVVEDAAGAIDFYKQAFGAEEQMRMPGPDGKIAHAELQIGDSKLMLSDPFPQSQVRPPSERGGPTASIFLYVEDVDATFDRAQSAGAEVEAELQDMFWGDRFGTLIDPFGHVWSIATHKEDLSEEEIAERSKAAMAEMGSS
jgi:PhnB protein